MNAARGRRFACGLILMLLFASGCIGGSGASLPQPGATYTGDMLIETSGSNASAGGAGFEIEITLDGTGINRAGYTLQDTRCSNASGSVSIESGGFSAIMTPSRPVDIIAGKFQFRIGNADVSGQFISPTQAIATIMITTEENAGMGQTIICDFGTWSWTGSAH
jgi:hypothetical protein